MFTDGTVDNNGGSRWSTTCSTTRGNHDVWNAHVDADQHYHVRWHEWRDPSAFFDTAFYLSVYPDVKASGIDPLVPVRPAGWEEGRVPSLSFDPANICAPIPMSRPRASIRSRISWHYRRPGGPPAIHASRAGRANGFDYAYYLQHYPDVAAAHVDPLQHFQSLGWHEGRNPNALFDTSGYLATYGDVAAAGINPLDHYHLYGWTEGRDPSQGFDTPTIISLTTPTLLPRILIRSPTSFRMASMRSARHWRMARGGRRQTG